MLRNIYHRYIKQIKDKKILNTKDIGVIEQMCAAGMSEEALYKIFKQFDREDIKSVYDHYRATHNDYVREDISIKTNCS